MKPDLDIYRRTLTRLGREPQEAVFIDDSHENVSAARQLGMHAIHYRKGLDVEKSLTQIGVATTSSETKESKQLDSQGDHPHA